MKYQERPPLHEGTGVLDGENPEYPLARRIRLTAESWRQWGPGPIWRRYAPEILPLKPSLDGSRNALLILRLIEEAPHIATLPRPERVATRKRRARKAWGDFFAVLDFALILLPLRHPRHLLPLRGWLDAGSPRKCRARPTPHRRELSQAGH